MKGSIKQPQQTAELKQATKLVMESVPYASEDVCAAAARKVIRYIRRKHARQLLEANVEIERLRELFKEQV